MMSNFIITLVGLGSVAYLLKSDVRTGSALLKRNLKTIRTWLEEEGATAAKPTGPPKSVEPPSSAGPKSDGRGPSA